MHRSWQVFIVAFWSSLFLNGVAAQEVAGRADVQSLSTRDIHGQEHPASSKERLRVYCFLGVECPIAKFYGVRLQNLQDRYAEHGVSFLAYFSNLHDSEADLRKYAEELQIKMPLIKDWDQKVALHFQAKRTAEVVVVDSRQQIRYRGRIDDQYEPGTKKPSPTVSDLQMAIDQLLAGESVSVSQTTPVGCIISYQRKVDLQSEITYCRTIAPVLQRYCLECHRPGEIGPFSVTEYDEVRGWAEMMLEVVEQKRMPPWHASPDHLPLSNARAFPEKHIEDLRRWIEAGTPYGDPKELPEPPTFLSGWRLPRDPELILTMRDRPFRVPATGTVEYQYFVVDPNLTEERWVSASQVIPGNASVVHHAIVFIRPPDGEEFRGISWLTAYVPGQRATEFPPGYARRVPAGSKLVFQMHYTPTGREELDVTKIGMNFIDEKEVTHEVYTSIGINQDFEIPPGASDFKVAAPVRMLPAEGELLAVIPHMHLRGKSFQLYSNSKSEVTERRKVLLEVPKYDFNWQHTYELVEPLRLDLFESLDFIAAFDNSKSNPFNPNPNEYVMWGDQTWEEMAVAFFEVAVPHVSNALDSLPSQAAMPNEWTDGATAKEMAVEQPSIEVVKYADDFIARFDANRDGVVLREELPRIVRDYGIWSIDLNYDGRVTREELLWAAKERRGR